MASATDQLRIVLIGRTGNGKSSTGNSLLHLRSTFHAMQSSISITKDCQKATGVCKDRSGRDRQLLVVDTPGFFDTNQQVTNKMVEKTIASQIFEMTSPGVHAFLIVIRIGRFTPEEKNTVDFIKTIFGPGAAKYCIVLFTNEDGLDEGQSLDDFIGLSPDLQDLVRTCGGRKFAINNRLNGQPLDKKTQQLFDLIDNMVNNNNGTFYTNDEYQRIERQRQEEQRRKKEAEIARKKAYEESLKAQAREEERRKAEKKEREDQARRKVEEARQKAAHAERENQLKREIEEERRRAERAQRDAEEAKRERDRFEARSMRSPMPSMCSGDSGLSGAFSQMGFGGPMGCGMDSPFSGGGSPSGGMSMPFSMGRQPSAGIGGGHGGRFTGDYVASRGRANGRPIFEGARGGQYYMTPGGNKSYLPK